MNKILFAAVGLVTLAALTTGVGCAPDPKTPADWQSKIAPSMESRKPAFAACFVQERARVAALPDDVNKKQLQDFLNQKVIVAVHLRIDGMSPSPDQIRVEDGNGGSVVQQPGNTNSVDGPLSQCVENAMQGLKQPFDAYYPSDGTWNVVFDPSVLATDPSNAPSATPAATPANTTTTAAPAPAATVKAGASVGGSL